VSQEKKESAEDLLAEDMARFYSNPYGWVLYAFDWNDGELSGFDGPDEWQKDFLIKWGDQIKERGFNGVTPVDPILMAAASGHGIGKSALSSWIILFIMSTRPHCKGVVTANTSEQLKTKTWAELGKWKKRCITGHWFTYNNGKGNMNLYHPDYAESWRVDAQTCREENSEAFAGLHAATSTPFYLYDEASAVPDKIWEVSEGGMTDGEPMWFAFGNPTRNSGRFRECFRKFKAWKLFQIDSRKAKMTNKSLLDKWVSMYGEDSDFVRVRVRGVFPRAGSTQFISGEDVFNAAQRTIPEEVYDSMPNILGVDVARFGDDQTVLAHRQGRKLHSLDKYRGLSTVQVANLIIKKHSEEKFDAIFVDGAGVGGGVVDQLVSLGYGSIVHEVNGGCSPFDEDKYLNKRAEMWDETKHWLAHADIPDDPELYEDFTEIQFKFTNKQQIQLESKPDMKKRGVSSPDCADAVTLTFAEPVNPLSKPRRSKKKKIKNWRTR